MSTKGSKFSAVTDFDSLRWKRMRVIAGDGADARICSLLYEASILECWPSWNRIRLSNRKTFWISSQTIDGKPAYLFKFWPLRELWRRRVLERRLLEWFCSAPWDEAKTMAGWITEAAGKPQRIWLSCERILLTVEEHLPNVGIPDLELLTELIQVDKAAESTLAA